MNYIPFILFVAAVIFVIYTQIQSNKDLKNIGAIIGGTGMIIVLAMMIFDFGSSGVKKGSKYLDNRNNKKESFELVVEWECLFSNTRRFN